LGSLGGWLDAVYGKPLCKVNEQQKDSSMKTVFLSMLLMLSAGCMVDKPCVAPSSDEAKKLVAAIDTRKKIALVNYGALNSVCETWFMKSDYGITLAKKKTELSLKDDEYKKKNPQEATSPYLAEEVSINNAIDAELKALTYKYVEKYTKGVFMMVIEDSNSINFLDDDYLIIDITPKIKSEILKDLAGGKR
jgi:hypothetical protein